MSEFGEFFGDQKTPFEREKALTVLYKEKPPTSPTIRQSRPIRGQYMSDVVIRVEDLSKRYRLGLIGRTALHEDLSRWWARLRGQPDPTMRLDELQKLEAKKERSSNGTDDHIWALRNIDFDVKRGEVLGIIGKNGAGKSTLLKILSRVTAPTVGCVKIRGRIASLLEVGTGFHPELTGRENIFLNGAILGMNKAEIRSKFDEIIAFAEVEKFVETPVKRYSSGMYVRLAFAVAAHLEPEILVVDEVLAVGDAAFQKRCLGKMKDVAGEGRTVLFVSHNMASIKNLCQSALLIEGGTLSMVGAAGSVVDHYLAGSVDSEQTIPGHAHRVLTDLQVESISFGRNSSVSATVLPYGDPVTLRLQIHNRFDHAITFFAGVEVKAGDTCICTLTSPELDVPAGASCTARCTVPQGVLRPGLLVFTVGLTNKTHSQLADLVVDCATLIISPPDSLEKDEAMQRARGLVAVPSHWDFP